MPRTGSHMHLSDAQDALLDALSSLDIEARPAGVDPGLGTDLLVHVGDIAVAVETRSVVTEAGAELIVGRARRMPWPVVVVADRIAEGAKITMRRGGVNYLDRRGELRLFAGPLKVDARVQSSVRAARSEPLSSQVAQEVAIACLLEPDRPHGVREIAAYIERAPSAVSKAMSELRAVGLLTSKGEATVPDLFQELSVRWRRRGVALADLPRPGRGTANAQLQLGLDDPANTTGWALTDTVAAVALGVPIVASGDYPPDFYVPNASVARRATALLRQTEYNQRRACTVAVAAVRLVCLRRVDHAEASGETWPLANHIVVALDLASDKARGLEALEQWRPQGITRAW